MKRFILTLILTCIQFQAYALIEVDITRGNLDPLPIAVSPLHVESKSENLGNLDVKKLGVNISSIIEKNFKSTGASTALTYFAV